MKKGAEFYGFEIKSSTKGKSIVFSLPFVAIILIIKVLLNEKSFIVSLPLLESMEII